MVIKTDLGMNNHSIKNSTDYLNGILNTNDAEVFTINGCDKLIIPNHGTIVSIKAMFLIEFRYP